LTGNINGLATKQYGPEYWKTSVLCKRKNECKNGYQPGTNLGKGENGYSATESTVLWLGQRIASNNVWNTEIHAVELLVPDSSFLAVEIAIEHLKRRRKSPGTNQTLVALMQSGGMTWIIHSNCTEKELRQQWEKFIFFLWRNNQTWAQAASLLKFLYHTD
jgi:hypothetical protein